MKKKNTDLEIRLARLWLHSVHCDAAIHSLAWRKRPTKNLASALDTICEVDGISAEIDARVEKRRAYLNGKGYVLPE